MQKSQFATGISLSWGCLYSFATAPSPLTSFFLSLFLSRLPASCTCPERQNRLQVWRGCVVQKDNNNLIVATFSMLLSLKCKYTFLSTPFTVCFFLFLFFALIITVCLRWVLRSWSHAALTFATHQRKWLHGLFVGNVYPVYISTGVLNLHCLYLGHLGHHWSFMILFRLGEFPLAILLVDPRQVFLFFLYLFLILFIFFLWFLCFSISIYGI